MFGFAPTKPFLSFDISEQNKFQVVSDYDKVFETPFHPPNSMVLGLSRGLFLLSAEVSTPLLAREFPPNLNFHVPPCIFYLQTYLYERYLLNIPHLKV